MTETYNGARAVGTYHFFEQVYVRYGLQLDEDDARLIADAIEAGMGVETGQESHATPGRKTYKIQFQNKVLHVIYALDGRRLITALADNESDVCYLAGDLPDESQFAAQLKSLNPAGAEKTEENKKVCPRCETVKALSEFYKSARAKSGYQSYCKDCQKQANRERAKNRELEANQVSERIVKRITDRPKPFFGGVIKRLFDWGQK